MTRASSTLPTDDVAIGSGVCSDRSFVEDDSSAQLDRKNIITPAMRLRESGSEIFGITLFLAFRFGRCNCREQYQNTYLLEEEARLTGEMVRTSF